MFKGGGTNPFAKRTEPKQIPLEPVISQQQAPPQQTTKRSEEIKDEFNISGDNYIDDVYDDDDFI